MTVLTVVTVAYNDLAGLQRTCASVDAQLAALAQAAEGLEAGDGATLEHIVVDGGSSDGSAQWLEALPAVPYRRVLSEPDKGAYDAMNKGWRLATGDLVMFLNSGDVFAGAGTARLVLDSYDGRWTWAVGASRMMHGDVVSRVHMIMPFDRRRFLLGIKSLPHQATIVTRQALEWAGGFDLDAGIAADQHLLAKLLLREEPRCIYEFLADCDDAGMSSELPMQSFVVSMRSIRRELGLSAFGNPLADVVGTAGAWCAMSALNLTK